VRQLLADDSFDEALGRLARKLDRDVSGVKAEAAGYLREMSATHSPRVDPAPRVLLRQYVTMEHLWTARHAARLCRERELQVQPNVADIEHRSLAMTAIFFAAAFLEALVNEVILDVFDPPAGGPSARVAGIPVDAKTTAAFQKLWKPAVADLGRQRNVLGPLGKNERRIKGGPLDKYQAALDPSPSPG
jgi:hypothetical protein